MKLSWWLKAFFMFSLLSHDLFGLTLVNGYGYPIEIWAWVLSNNDVRHVALPKTTLEPHKSIDLPKRFDLTMNLYVEVVPVEGSQKNPHKETFLLYLDPEKRAPIPVEGIKIGDASSTLFLSEKGALEAYDIEPLDEQQENNNPVQLGIEIIQVGQSPRNEKNIQQQFYESKMKKELDAEEEVKTLKDKLLSLNFIPEVANEVIRQFKQLERTPKESGEYSMKMTFLELLAALPWNKSTVDSEDLVRAKEILDADHFGMTKAKEKILDYLGARIYSSKFPDSTSTVPASSRSTIICLVGPPGVGKTSLGKSVAACLGRKFQKISVGGVDDVAEIMGHRKTYVEAIPGRIIAALRKAESNNPVLLIDEIDKMGVGRGGSPAAALLETLDPEQNKQFTDRYLGLPFDLSKVLFITTANSLETIPHALLDRMEVIELSGYTLEEKIAIAQNYLLPRCIREANLQSTEFTINHDVLTELISKYAREAGVRRLEEHVRTLTKKYARAIVETGYGITFTVQNLSTYLGPRNYQLSEERVRENRIGGANALAWSPSGGCVMQIQACLIKGNGRLMLTGNLGETMKESAQTALTYAQAHAQELGIDPNIFTTHDIRLHVPTGGVQKDGPSAGISMCAALVSLLSDREYNGSFAMTGEIDLLGHVLPIGGVKEKVLAAKQHGVDTVLLPRDNYETYKEIEQDLKGINIIWVDTMDEVLHNVLLPSKKVAAMPTSAPAAATAHL